MSYRSVLENKKKKQVNSTLIYFFVFMLVISFSGYCYLKIKNNIYNLKNHNIPALKKRITNLNNFIAIENNNNNSFKRNLIRIKAEELGMIKADYSDIIDAWWNEKVNE